MKLHVLVMQFAITKFVMSNCTHELLEIDVALTIYVVLFAAGAVFHVIVDSLQLLLVAYTAG
jgi:hypothetical protein